ncbi:Rho termination factor N-terminal domain-containing protein, partial [Paenibacillus wynnii]|uniref:Rho termination factor N-terminal domain-containing protein n=1 Tax=Paenibacillus wynnii TaxID=268407 RepID=UPI00056595B0
MAYVTYRGKNASLRLHSIRFEPVLPILVESESVLKHFRNLSDFEVQEEKVIPLEDLSVVQLKDKAKVAGIEGFSDLKKPELLAALKALEGKGQLDANNDTP